MAEEKKEHAEELAKVLALTKPWSGLFKKNISERHNLIQQHVLPSVDTTLLTSGGLVPARADMMVENCIGILGMPLGIVPNLILNGKHLVVPMAVEEPSVIAAAAGVCKLVGACGGFVGHSTTNTMTGQVQILDLGTEEDVEEQAVATINASKAELIKHCNTFCASMVKRGGGVTDVVPRVVRPRIRPAQEMEEPGVQTRWRSNVKPYLVVEFHMNVCEAMGANAINTVAEGLAPRLVAVVGGKARAGLKILTNMCAQRTTTCTFKIPFTKLSYKGIEGSAVAERILEAYNLAYDDINRAVTNNKGTMNGIDAVALATGQDWRALEAAAHCWAFTQGNGQYSSLASYCIQTHKDWPEPKLVGSLTLPVAVGTVGGALHSHPLYAQNLQLLGNPNAATLSQIIVSIGLAQNFAAMRALATEGIQRGHMSLHARNVAVSAGVAAERIPACVEYMTKIGKISKAGAKQFLAQP